VKEKKGHSALLIASLLFVVILAALMLMPHGLKRRAQGGIASILLPAPNDAEAAEVNSWSQAVQKVKEDRGVPVGKQAQVETPPQLRHYSDKRRFLATQVAEWREHRFSTPRDFLDLAAMLKSGEMVELQPVTQDYILFGVGGSADKAPFTRYEKGKSITLYNQTDLAQEYVELAESDAALENEITGLKHDINSLNRRERSAHARLQNQLGEKEKALKALRDSKELLDHHYGDAGERQKLFSNYESLENLAKSLSGKKYDLENARSRQALKVRMLSSLRPEALKVLEEIAGSYRQKFERPLPISSLVRPDAYQYALSKVNPNAVRIETPPHSTGLAFDIFNRYMSAEEQTYVMDYLARLKDEGRIEVLRENRDHYHVFAFVDGKRPDESFIRASLGSVSSSGATKETKSSE
jgi:DNA repair exonuclease SbcCD ATPase subunit